MDCVTDFETSLAQHAPYKGAVWRKIDLHNHSPASYDFRGSAVTAVEDYAAKLRAELIDLVMFTDHMVAPNLEFIHKLRAAAPQTQVLTGVELNIEIEAFDRALGKVDRVLYFHLLVGFAVDEEAHIPGLLETLRRNHGVRTVAAGNKSMEVLRGGLSEIVRTIRKYRTLVIPAHLHSSKNAYKSRSLDDICSDEMFLESLELFDALEVVDKKTARFFDGTCEELGRKTKACVMSSDAHEPSELGRRSCWVQAAGTTFADISAALRFRSRVQLTEPHKPAQFIVGLHVQGSYLRDHWQSFSPNCNVLIGVKGSGKTSVLECIRFALGSTIPSRRADEVTRHRQHILGPTGVVRLLLQRADGVRVILERSMSTPASYTLRFADGRTETFDRPDPMAFGAYVLGWHEIEDVATSPVLRRQYLDEIAGRTSVDRINAAVVSVVSRAQLLHQQAAANCALYRDYTEKIRQREQLKAGLQELQDSKALELQSEMEISTAQLAHVQTSIAAIEKLKAQLPQEAKRLSVPGPGVLSTPSPIGVACSAATSILVELESFLDRFVSEYGAAIAQASERMRSASEGAHVAFASFEETYRERVSTLTPELQRILQSHLAIARDTQDLPSLRMMLERVETDLRGQLVELVAVCKQIEELLEQRTRLRCDGVERFMREKTPAGLRLTVMARQSSDEEQDLRNRFTRGASAYSTVSSMGGGAWWHGCLRRVYEQFIEDLGRRDIPVFDEPEFQNYLGLVQQDNLLIEYDPSEAKGSYRPIDQLSAGQRCTAVFPILLGLDQGVLIMDQPEDNLDNRHIAGRIAPQVLVDKHRRQILFTSHNANLVVLSDAENVAAFLEKDGAGSVVAEGFLAHERSEIAGEVIETLDGGRAALEMRRVKYGSG